MNLKTIHILLGLSLCLFVVSFLQTKEGFIEGICGKKCKKVNKKKRRRKKQQKQRHKNKNKNKRNT